MKKLKKITVIILSLTFLFSAYCFANTRAKTLYVQANMHYEKGEYKTAIEKYEQILLPGFKNADVYYNLANAYYKTKQIGKAILNYERALRLAPRDNDIKANLALARALNKDKIKDNDNIFIGWIIYVHNILNVNEQTIAVSIFFLITILIALLSVFSPSLYDLLKKTQILFVILFLLTITSLSIKIFNQYHIVKGIVIKNKIDVHSGPSDKYAVVFSLHEGTKVKIEDYRNKWYNIYLSDQLKGWTKKEGIEQI